MQTQTQSASDGKTQELPNECSIEIEMQCTECGHKQLVKGTRHDGRNYFGSGYNWCDKCDGLPKPVAGAKLRQKA